VDDEGGGTIHLELDGLPAAEGLIVAGDAGSEAFGTLPYRAAAGSIGRIHIDHGAGSAQLCDAAVSVAITDPDTTAVGEPVVGTFWTDFATDTLGETYPLGGIPPGWATMYGTGSEWAVESRTGATAGRVFRCPVSSTSKAAAWTAAGAGATVEIVARVLSQHNSDRARVAIRIGDESSVSYEVGILPRDNIIDFARWNGSSYSPVASASMPVSVNVYYWVRARGSGALFEAKAWPASDPEPSGWMLSWTDPAPALTGYAGVPPTIDTAGGRIVDVFGVAFGGDRAPMEDPRL
jgi:hypothetical protein